MRLDRRRTRGKSQVMQLREIAPKRLLTVETIRQIPFSRLVRSRAATDIDAIEFMSHVHIFSPFGETG
jgi:hypothetical protein